jgi:LemA protein
MNLVAILLIVAVLSVIGYLVSTYNYFQTFRTRINASIQEIGNQLKRQASLIPNLAESTKSYLEHEQDIYQKITEARNAVDQAAAQGGEAVDAAVEKMNALIPKLNVLVESNPELKANTVVTKLMDELRDTADKLMYARRTLIDLTADYNTKIVTFPSNLVANAFGFKTLAGLTVPNQTSLTTVTEAETQDIKVDLK